MQIAWITKELQTIMIVYDGVNTVRYEYIHKRHDLQRC